MPGLLFDVENPYRKATGVEGQAADTMSRQMKQQSTTTKQNKSVGGALNSAMSMASAGAMIPGVGPWGAVGGAALGLISYALF